MILDSKIYFIVMLDHVILHDDPKVAQVLYDFCNIKFFFKKVVALVIEFEQFILFVFSGYTTSETSKCCEKVKDVEI